MMRDFYSIVDIAYEGGRLSADEIAVLLKAEGLEQAALFAAADLIRRDVVGDGVHLRALIEISNDCMRNCLYCGLRKGNTQLQRYCMTADEIVDAAAVAIERGYGSIVLQSGEGTGLSIDLLGDVIVRIKSIANVAITLSIGEHSKKDFQILKDAGADRFLMRHETADDVLYSKIHPGDSLSNRLRNIKILKGLDYQIGAGMMVGIPGQTIYSLAKDVLLLRDLEVDMAGIGPFIANPQTPFGREKNGSLALTLNCLAVTRLVVRHVHMPATTALGTIHPAGRRLGLLAGANVIMPVFTPAKYTGMYDLYPDKVSLGQDVQDSEENITKLLKSIGRSVAVGPGHSVRNKGGIRCE